MDIPEFSKNKENDNEKLQKQQQIINDIKKNLNSNSNNEWNLFQTTITKETKMQLKLPKKKKKLPPLTGIQKKIWISKDTKCTKEFYKDTLRKIKRNWNYTNHIFIKTCNNNKCLIK